MLRQSIWHFACLDIGDDMHSVQTMQEVWIHPQGCIHFARNQIVRVAMFLHHKPGLSYWLRFCVSILLGIWGTFHKGASIVCEPDC